MGLFDLYLRHGHYRAALRQLEDSEAPAQLERLLQHLKVHPGRAARRAGDAGLRERLRELAGVLPAAAQAPLSQLEALFAHCVPMVAAWPASLAGVGAVLGFVALGEGGAAEQQIGLAVPWLAEADREAEEPPIGLAADAVAARGRARAALLELLLEELEAEPYLLRRLLHARCAPRLRGFGRRILRGDSLGLAHFCALFSYVFEIPVDPTVAVAGALARHDASFAAEGTLGSLGGHLLKPVSMRGKVRSLLLDAPWVRRLVLPGANVRELQADPELGPELRRAGVELVRGRDLFEVVEQIFPLDELRARWCASSWRCLRPPAPAGSPVLVEGPWPLAVCGPEQAVEARCQSLASAWPAVYRLDPVKLLPFLSAEAPLDSLVSYLKARLPCGPRSLFAARLRKALATGELGLVVERLRPGGGAQARELLFRTLEAVARSFPRAPLLLGCAAGLAPSSWRQETLREPLPEDFLAWLRRRLLATVGEEREPWVLRAAADLACYTSVEPSGVPEGRLVRKAAQRAGRQAAERAVRLLESWGVLEPRADASASAIRLLFSDARRQAALVGEALREREDPGAFLSELFTAGGEDAQLLLQAGVRAALAGCPEARAASLQSAWQELCT